ncbi:MAG: hypothetical protein MUC50_06870 [Myxococcota bacterium]|nr:hypothetical protein [Myxococcota bacterium]
MIRKLPAIAVLALLASCAEVLPKQPTQIVFNPRTLFDDSAFKPVEGVPPQSELFALGQNTLDQFRADYQSGFRVGGSKRLWFVQYIHEMYKTFSYSDTTTSAQEALTNQKANCLGLALLTAAAAREFRLPYVFQEVLAPPTWDRKNGMMLVNKHVNVWVFDPTHPGDEYKMDLQQVPLNGTASIIDFFPMAQSYPASYLADHQVVSMFYANVAAEALIEQSLDKAYAFIRKALEIDPAFAAGWNILGLVYSHRRHKLTAPTYLYALSLSPNDLSLINNISVWFDRTGNADEAAKWKALIANARARNPFYYFDRAEIAFKQKDYRTAATLYQKAALADPYQHEFQFGLFKAYWMMQKYDRARDALLKAVEIAEDGETVARYNQKLQMLSATTPPPGSHVSRQILEGR